MPALMRGGDAIDVQLADRSFTVRLPRAGALDALRKQPEVEAVQPLTSRLARVTAGDVPGRRDLVKRLTEQWRWPVEPTYEDGDGHRFDATRELIVGFHPGTKPEHVREALATLGAGNGRVKRAYDHLDGTYLVELGGDVATSVGGAATLAGHDAVAYADPAIVNRFAPQAIDPADDQYPHQWHLYSEESLLPDVVQNADARVRAAWATTKGSRQIVVAVLDDGFDLSHPDLQGHGKVVAPVDFTDGDHNPMPSGKDYHGTCCAGVAIAEENGSGVVGVAPHCAFLPVRFPFSVPDPVLIDIFRYVSARAHVASCSWSPLPGYRPLNAGVSATLTELAANGGRDGRGLIVCVAAGNFAAPVNGTPDKPVTWYEPGEDGQPGQHHSYSGPVLNGLAAHPSVIAVGAVTSYAERAQYSNHGPEVAVAAPSGDYDPNTLDRGRGRGITTTDNEASGPGYTAGKRFTSAFSGTSAATAVIAGVAGLVKSHTPELTAAEVKQALASTAEAIEDPGATTAFPGKVNARRAVAEARPASYEPPAPAQPQQPPAMPPQAGPPAMTVTISFGYGPAPAGWVPGGSGPSGWVPGTSPAGWVPGGTAPSGWVPGGEAPAGWVPGGWVPGGWVPGGWVPAAGCRAAGSPAETCPRAGSRAAGCRAGRPRTAAGPRTRRRVAPRAPPGGARAPASPPRGMPPGRRRRAPARARDRLRDRAARASRRGRRRRAPPSPPRR